MSISESFADESISNSGEPTASNDMTPEAEPAHDEDVIVIQRSRFAKTRILLIFDEHEVARTQEFVLRWSPEAGAPYREIVRQQWNFSPSNTVRELEDYRVELSNVSVLELIISPDIGQARAAASRTQLPIG